MNGIITAREGANNAAGRGWYLAPMRSQPGQLKKAKGDFLRHCTNDPSRVASWYAGGKSPNYGVVASKSDLVILDEDEHGALDRFADELGIDLPPTFTVKTANGRHLYFAAEGVEYSQRGLIPGVDVRFDGYVVGPGSVHETDDLRDGDEVDGLGIPMPHPWHEIDGDYRTVDDRDPAPVPDLLREYLTAATETAPERLEAPEGATGPTASPEWLRAVREGALEDLAETVALPEGATDRNGKTWESGALHARACRLVEVSNADPEAYPIEDARADYVGAAPSGFERSFAHHWDDALEQIGGRAASPNGDPADEFEPMPDEPKTKRPGFTPLNWASLLAGPPPEPDWVLWPIAERGQSVSLYSTPKDGKSLLMLDVLWRAAAGEKVLGQPAKDPVRVLYVDAENTPRELHKRLGNMGADPAQLEGFIYLLHAPIGQLDTKPGAAQLVRLVDEHQADLVVIDTISRFIEGAENDADTWLKVYREALEPLKAREVAVIRLDHSGKDADRGERGSSAKNGDVDVSWQLTYNRAHETRTLTRKLTRSGNGPERLVLNVQEGPLRHEAATEFDRPDPVAELIEKLDELDAEPDLGRRLAAVLLRENGLSFSDKNLREALLLRKAGRGAK